MSEYPIDRLHHARDRAERFATRAEAVEVASWIMPRFSWLVLELAPDQFVIATRAGFDECDRWQHVRPGLRYLTPSNTTEDLDDVETFPNRGAAVAAAIRLGGIDRGFYAVRFWSDAHWAIAHGFHTWVAKGGVA